MDTTTVLFIIVFVVLIWLYVQNCHESFYIDPNTIVGGAVEGINSVRSSDGHYYLYSTPLELEGPLPGDDNY